MFKDLNDFIAALDKARELARITDPVSPDLEISAVTDRVSKSPGGGPGLLFERPTGFDMPVAVNLFGSMKRVCMALGVQTLDDLATEIDELATPKIPTGMLDALKLLPTVNRLRDLLPKTVKDGPCQEVVQKNGTLDDIPILKCWPEDGGPYITFPLCSPRIPRPGCGTSGHIACRCSTVATPECTGSVTREARSTIVSPSALESRCPWPWPWDRIPRWHIRRPRRCRRVSTS
jgi:4-hydroxy-3-polyprenylbenzoate decarboxylase